MKNKIKKIDDNIFLKILNLNEYEILSFHKNKVERIFIKIHDKKLNLYINRERIEITHKFILFGIEYKYEYCYKDGYKLRVGNRVILNTDILDYLSNIIFENF